MPGRQEGLRTSLRAGRKGLLAKPTHGNIIRFAPPWMLDREQMEDCCAIIERVPLGFEKCFGRSLRPPQSFLS